MLPFVFHYDDVFIPTYFFMIMVASLATTFYLYWQAPKKGYSQIVCLDISLVGTITGILGARLFHIFFEAPGYYWDNPHYVFYIWQGGFVGYGAFIGVTAGCLVYFMIKKLPVLEYADFVALGGPIIVFLVRVGCVGAGCCYGTPTDFFIHFTFTHPGSDAARDFLGVPLHATQLYDMMNSAFAFFMVNRYVYPNKKFHGQVMLTFFMIYAFFRFFIEYLRGDMDRGVYLDGLISTSQIVSLVILSLGSFLYYYLGRKKLVKAS